MVSRAGLPFRPLLALAALAGIARAQDVIGEFPDVWVPPGNPLTKDKVLLGMALFFEEQLSSDDTVACATCHMPEAGGGEPRPAARHPGLDGLLGTTDDEFGSHGIGLHDRNNEFANHPLYGIQPQATARNSPPAIGAAFFNTQFWDQRALPVFHDLDGAILLPQWASLESQAVEPIISPVEMGHEQRTWQDVTAKLSIVRPLELATDVPVGLVRFIAGSDTYGPLFQAAFGTSEVTRERIAMAIASYERTLVPDQTPFDLGTMTPRQLEGLRVFQERGLCETCHPSSTRIFSDGASRTIFLDEHPRFAKTPSLRNVGLRRRFMSGGVFTGLDQVLDHYRSIDFLQDVTLDERTALLDFLGNALTDPRVAERRPPFDRPTLRGERAPWGSNVWGKGTPGSEGIVPEIAAGSPPFVGNARFQIGLGRAQGGVRAVLALARERSAPGTAVHGVPVSVELDGSLRYVVVTSGAGSGKGAATYHASVPADPGLIGMQLHAQWFVSDPGALTGVSATPAATFELFGRKLLE